jgi:hypothetical protein
LGVETTLAVFRVGAYVNPSKIDDPKYKVELIKGRFPVPPFPLWTPWNNNSGGNRCGK